ncbi:hypothetical protein LJC16_02080 [Bacteroidales bacterium OttesenSCG-928-C19]|nr:hypothetical protein [Bacteroidales bacterium OttesenSCG-928-C19]
MKYISSAIIVCLLSVCSVFGQEETKTYDEKVIVVSGYEPTLKDAVKIITNPSLIDTAVVRTPIQYNISSKKLTTPFVPEQLKPAKIVGEPITQLYRNYLKLGIGSHLMPYAEFYHSNTRSKNVLYGAYFNHLSSWLPIPDYANSSYSNNELQIFGKRMFKNAMLSGNVFYENNYYHYYGFKDHKDSLMSLLGTEKVKGKEYVQSFHNVGFDVSYKSTYDNIEKLHHSADLHLSDLIGKYGLNELNVKLNAGLQKRFNFINYERQTIGLNFSWEHFYDKRDSTKLPVGYTGVLGEGKRTGNASIFDINPYLLLNYFGFNFTAGLHGYFSVTPDSTGFNLYPEIIASRSFLNQMLFLKFGISGSMERASLNSLRTENPYISPLAESQFVKNPLNIFGRVELALEKHLDLNAEIAYSSFKDAPLFGVDSSYILQNMYVPIYDDYKRFKIGGELVYEEENIARFGLGYYYYGYSTDKEDEAWYKPSFELTLNAKYMIQDKFIFGLTAGFLGKMKGYSWLRNETTGQLIKEEEEMKNRFDISLSAEYMYSKRLSFFFLLNNIANQQYYQWINYPTQRMNAMLGLTFSF